MSLYDISCIILFTVLFRILSHGACICKVCWQFVTVVSPHARDRVTMTTLEDFEARMNVQIERNALLENELDEKEKTVVMCQRLKDEVRDLRSEININQKKSVQHAPQTEAPADSPVGTPSKPPVQGRIAVGCL